MSPPRQGAGEMHPQGCARLAQREGGLGEVRPRPAAHRTGEAVGFQRQSEACAVEPPVAVGILVRGDRVGAWRDALEGEQRAARRGRRVVTAGAGRLRKAALAQGDSHPAGARLDPVHLHLDGRGRSGQRDGAESRDQDDLGA